ncbi:ribosomal protein small subunit S6 [Thermoplasma volcanium GSS1]|uniref:Small ribosomal subunit protein eS6 n=1 Tax=Thermoplasma volcanium (strain ATCC 51530 / DSM 4299 / JCM 9571 / NBRC 15438 / GSS1) TaxID=273116 RepID=RS6E_THEVO|nr:30S ribosomal protein S6e [Thermoplasma volcanium]Q978W7.1 RecName: Full=Small ribosomal subunit protein eS6; AltName: Full=30S ribosomal protein S6e [Thermoplasma volcanium GSS1]BAB60440.1 ribosomal protein small subunit S6 [Thermoplasma volcanium GSS1]
MANSLAIIADPKTGKTYKREIPSERMSSLIGRKIGEEVDGVFFDLVGYKMKITGGSSVDGFAMRPDLQTQGKKQILVKYTSGYRGKNGIRKRITARGSIIGSDITQINLKITQYGPTPIEEKKDDQQA